MSEQVIDSASPDREAAPVTCSSVIRGWWITLNERRGDRSDLRRARTPSAVVFLPVYHRLLRDLRRAQIGLPDDRAALIAGVVAHVERDDGSRSFAAQMAAEHNGKARVSGLRFRRFLTIDDPADLHVALVRMIHLLDRTASVADVAESIRWWNDRTKKRWAIEYYATAPTEE